MPHNRYIIRKLSSGSRRRRNKGDNSENESGGMAERLLLEFFSRMLHVFVGCLHLTRVVFCWSGEQVSGQLGAWRFGLVDSRPRQISRRLVHQISQDIDCRHKVVPDTAIHSRMHGRNRWSDSWVGLLCVFLLSFSSLGFSWHSCIQLRLKVVVSIRTVAKFPFYCHVFHFFSEIAKLG